MDVHRFLLTDLRKLATVLPTFHRRPPRELAVGQFLEDHINLWFDIFSLLDLKSQLSLLFTCSSFNNLSIIDLCNIDEKYLDILTDNILRLHVFKYVIKLTSNNKITNVSFMKNLKKLDASDDCGIDQSGIKELNLVELNADDNNKITNVSFMKKLKKLNASYNCGIDQNGIKGLDLVELYTIGNNKITDVLFMKNLKIYIK